MIQKRVDAAMGRIDCDVAIRGVTFLDVFSCEWKTGDISLYDGRIVGLEPGLRARREVDGQGKYLVPGFIDAHVHVESSMMLPGYFEQAVLPCGTTTAMCDPHEIANVLGVKGIQYFLDCSTKLSMDLWVMLSSCVPATHLETNGGGTITAKDLLSLAPHPRALGLAEMMNMPGVLHGDPNVMEKLEAFSGHIIDGHCPLLSGKELSAYATAGISSCHESSELAEAKEKLLKGLSVWIREGSVAKDLEALSPLLSLATSTSLGFCTDDRNPLDIAAEGHIDHLIRGSIQSGVAPEVAYRAATWSVARHYGLHQGPERVGAIAPGYLADLVLLDDAQSCSISMVMKRGRFANEIEWFHHDRGEMENTIRADAPNAKDLIGPEGNVHVMDVIPGKIITGRSVSAHNAPGIARMSVQERYGHGGTPANGYVRGFGENLSGAIGSSVGHDSHNLCTVGQDPEDMQVALSALRSTGGGFCVVKDRQVVAQVDLPFGGLMSSKSPGELEGEIKNLKEASASIGCVLDEPFLQLAFMCLPVIPSLKLTDKGLVDVDAFQIIDTRAS